MEIGANYVLRSGVEFGKVERAQDEYPILARIQRTYESGSNLDSERREESDLTRLAQKPEDRRDIYADRPISSATLVLYNESGAYSVV